MKHLKGRLLNACEAEIRAAIKQGGTYAEAARILGVHRQTFRKWCRRLGIARRRATYGHEKKT